MNVDILKYLKNTYRPNVFYCCEVRILLQNILNRHICSFIQDGKFDVADARTKLKDNLISIYSIKFWNNLIVGISNIKPLKNFNLTLRSMLLIVNKSWVHPFSII